MTPKAQSRGCPWELKLRLGSLEDEGQGWERPGKERRPRWRQGRWQARLSGREGEAGAPPASPEQLKLAGLKLIGYNFTQQHVWQGLAGGQPSPWSSPGAF